MSGPFDDVIGQDFVDMLQEIFGEDSVFVDDDFIDSDDVSWPDGDESTGFEGDDDNDEDD